MALRAWSALQHEALSANKGAFLSVSRDQVLRACVCGEKGGSGQTTSGRALRLEHAMCGTEIAYVECVCNTICGTELGSKARDGRVGHVMWWYRT
eukprot:667017-Rhodomonas_salina.1